MKQKTLLEEVTQGISEETGLTGKPLMAAVFVSYLYGINTIIEIKKDAGKSVTSLYGYHNYLIAKLHNYSETGEFDVEPEMINPIAQAVGLV